MMPMSMPMSFDKMTRIPFDKWVENLDLKKWFIFTECEYCEGTGYLACQECEDGLVPCPECEGYGIDKTEGYSARSVLHSSKLIEQGVDVPSCYDQDGNFDKTELMPIYELRGQYYAIREEERLLFDERIAHP